MDKRQLRAFEKKLTARYEELHAAVQRNIDHGRASGGRAADVGDIATEAFEKEMVFGHNTSALQHLRLSEEALKRITAGTFGYCTLCESEISPQRLSALPWTPCITCQEQLKRSE